MSFWDNNQQALADRAMDRVILNEARTAPERAAYRVSIEHRNGSYADLDLELSNDEKRQIGHTLRFTADIADFSIDRYPIEGIAAFRKRFDEFIEINRDAPTPRQHDEDCITRCPYGPDEKCRIGHACQLCAEATSQLP